MSKTENELITVAVIEDDTEVRRSLVGILQRGPGVICVGDYGTAEEALREIPQVQPKVALMDINLPGIGRRSLRAAAERIVTHHPGAHAHRL